MRRLLSVGAVACALGTSIPGCYWLASYSDLSSTWGQDASTEASDAIAEASGDRQIPLPDADTGPHCPDPTMINAGTFCVDATEVATNDYDVFSAIGVDAGITECTWKTSYQQLGTSGCGESGQLPVVGVDWCDAYAYCAWKGKRLCGKLQSSGAGSGAVDMADINNPLLDEWFYACTQGGTASRVYPYGSTFNVSACNGGGGPGDGGAVISGSLTSCQGGFPGIFDMSGNVWEWEDACDDGGGAGNPAADNCAVRGGSWATQPMVDLACASNNPGFQRNINANGPTCDFGIRCCADLMPN